MSGVHWIYKFSMQLINSQDVYPNKKTEKKKQPNDCFLWAQLGSNQRPPDYESGALTS